MSMARPAVTGAALAIARKERPARHRPGYFDAVGVPFAVTTLALALVACAARGSSTSQATASTEGPARNAGDTFDPGDDEAIGAALAGTGLHGWVHGAVPAAGLYVFTYRLRGDFFRYADFPMIPASAAIERALSGLSRHDEVRLRGRLVKNGPQRHIVVEQVEVEIEYVARHSAPEYRYDAALPTRVREARELVGRVHAVGAEGGLLVVEFGDVVVPVVVERPELAAELWRNDKIRLRYVLADHPGQPTHLRLDLQAEAPLERLERIAAGHGEPIEVEGDLVLFPKSPQITLDIWALRVIDADRVEREYTLVNFEDAAAFAAIREKLAAAWDASGEAPVDARNKFVKPGLKVRASGILNVISPAQANPQILLGGSDDVVVTRG